LPEAIINIQEIIDKVEIYCFIGMYYFLNTISLRIYKSEDELDNGVRGRKCLFTLTMVGAEKDTGTNA
jgi:DNA polymerase-3 subunit alpha